MTADRRYDGERRFGERLATVEANDKAQDRTLEAIAPVAAHIAELNVHYEDIKNSLADIQPRLRKLEYAIVALTVTTASAVASPLLGGPSVGQSVAHVMHYLT